MVLNPFTHSRLDAKYYVRGESLRQYDGVRGESLRQYDGPCL